MCVCVFCLLPSYGVAALGFLVGTLIKLVYTASCGGGADGADLRFAKFERRRLQECFDFIRAEGLLACNGGTHVAAYSFGFSYHDTEREFRTSVVCWRGEMGRTARCLVPLCRSLIRQELGYSLPHLQISIVAMISSQRI